MDAILEHQVSGNYSTGESSRSIGESSRSSRSEDIASSVAIEIHSMFGKVTHKRPSIYKVPEHLRNLNENAYTPWHVSIGPYHHKSHRYRVMEEYKMVYLKSLISHRRDRSSRMSKDINDEVVTKEDIDEYVIELEKLEVEARSCYAEKVDLDREEFVKMLLIDGCFVVEFLCRKLRKLAKFDDEAMPYYKEMFAFIQKTYNQFQIHDDFILKSSRTAFEVRRDLTLLENQLPYFVLETLFNFTFNSNFRAPNFRTIAYCGLRTSIPNISHILTEADIVERIEIEPDAAAHFVSLLKSYCGPVLERLEGIGSPFLVHQNGDDEHRVVCMERVSTGEMFEFPCLCNMKTHEIRVPCATVLAKSGVLFEKMGGANPLLHLSFDNRKGVLMMPVLILWHHTESFFRNIMAYELYNHTANYSRNVSVSDYMCFMDDLINSKEDVAVLVKSGILQNWLESDEVVADLFNSITKHILADYSSYSGTCEQMNQFRKKYNIRQLTAVLKQDYFNQPWAIIYFITAVVIQTAASITETIFSINENREKTQ